MMSSLSSDASTPLETTRLEGVASSSADELALVPLCIDASRCEDAQHVLHWLQATLPQWPGLAAETPLEIRVGLLRWSADQLTELPAVVTALGYRFHSLSAQHPETRHLARRQGMALNALTPAVAPSPASTATLMTQVVESTLRSGQWISSAGHLLVIGDVNAGAEVSAVGDITVWGELKGVAHAGVEGNTRAQVRALRLDALQLRIAHAIARRPDQWVETSQADRLTRQSSDGFYQPEVARIDHDEIRIFTYR